MILLAQVTTWPTTLPIDPQVLHDPLVRKLGLAAAALIGLVVLLRVLGRWRARTAVARRRAELQRTFESLRLQQAEIERLARQVLATSSTTRIVGYAIVRQVETVFSEPRPSSLQAVELLKALAAQKGANAIINLKTEQMATGKWVASGDAVVVRAFG